MFGVCNITRQLPFGPVFDFIIKLKAKTDITYDLIKVITRMKVFPELIKDIEKIMLSYISIT